MGSLTGYKLFIAQYTSREPVLNDGRDILHGNILVRGILMEFEAMLIK